MKFGLALLLLVVTPAYGVGLKDSMRNWKAATVEERAQLLKDVLLDRGPVERSRLLFCMDQSANTRLLVQKPVSEMIELCLKSPE